MSYRLKCALSTTDPSLHAFIAVVEYKTLHLLRFLLIVFKLYCFLIIKSVFYILCLCKSPLLLMITRSNLVFYFLEVQLQDSFFTTFIKTQLRNTKEENLILLRSFRATFWGDVQNKNTIKTISMYCENARIYIHPVFCHSVQTIQIPDYSFGSIVNPVF